MTQTRTILISHSPKKRDLASQIADQLRGRQLNIDVFTSLDLNISEISIFIALFDDSYKSNFSCKFEANEASRKQKPTVVVRIGSHTEFGLLFEQIFETSIQLSLSSEDSVFEISRLVENLENSIQYLSDENRIQFTSSPKFDTKFQFRDKDVEVIQTSIQKFDNHSPILIYGEEKIGKSHLLLHALQTIDIGTVEFRTVLWINCLKFSNSDEMTEKSRNLVDESIVRIAQSQFTEMFGFEDLKKFKILLVFDDVNTLELLSYLTDKMSGIENIPTVFITPQLIREFVQLDVELSMKLHNCIEIQPLHGTQIVQILKSRNSNGMEFLEDLAKFAALSYGRPGLAIEMMEMDGKEKSKSSKSGRKPAGAPHLDARKLVKSFQQKQQQLENAYSPSTYKSVFECLPKAPRNNLYFPRKSDEQALLVGIRQACMAPHQGGFLVLGNGGSGKTTLMLSLLNSNELVGYFNQSCNIQTAFWINCSLWRYGIKTRVDEDDFIDGLLQIGSIHSNIQRTDTWKTIRAMEESFRKNNRRILYVFDDCYQTSIIEVFRKHSPSSPFCIISRSPKKLENHVRIQDHYWLQNFTEQEIVNIFHVQFDLKDKISSSQLNNMASLCSGSPFLVSLLGTSKAKKFPSKKPDQLASYVIRQQIDRLDTEEKLLYFSLLLFGPNEPFSAEEFAKLWQIPLEDSKHFLNSLLKIGLVVGIEIKYIEYENFEFHHILHDVASSGAKTYLDLWENANLSQLRLHIAKRLLQRLEPSTLTLNMANSFGSFLCKLIELDLTSIFLATVRNVDSRQLKPLFDLIEPVRDKEYADTALVQAALNCDSSILVRFLSQMFENSAKQSGEPDNRSALHSAASNNLASARYLVDLWPGAISHESDTGDLPIHEAARTGRLETLRFLHHQWPSSIEKLTSKGETVLHLAVSKPNNFQMIRFICQVFPESIKMTDNSNETPLAIASKWQDLPTIKFLYRKNPEAIQTPNAEGLLPLHQSAFYQNLETVQFLFGRFPVLVEKMENGFETPLSIAVRSQSIDVIQFFAEMWPEALEIRTFDGQTVLGEAACYQGLEVVKLLVSLNPESVKMSDSNQVTPLQTAVKAGNLEVIRFLFDHYPDAIEKTNNFQETCLHSACDNGDVRIVDFLLEMLPESIERRNGDRETALHISASWNDDTEITRRLVQKWPDAVEAPDYAGMTPVLKAAEFKNLENCRYLAKNFPGTISILSSNNETLLFHASAINDLSFIKFVYESWPEAVKVPTNTKEIALFNAVKSGSLEIVRFLVEKWPESVSFQDSEGNNILHNMMNDVANPNIVKFIVESNPEGLKVRNNKRELPLHRALHLQHPDVIRYLIESSPETVEVEGNQEGETCLHIACENHGLSVVQFIYNRNPDSIRSLTSFGETPLHIASRYREVDTVKFLVEKYPQAIRIQSTFGKLPIHYAAETYNFKIVRLLLNLFPSTAKVQTPYGTLLHYACTFAKFDLIKLVYEKWPEAVKVLDNDKNSCLHNAVERQPIEVVKFICDKWTEALQIQNLQGIIPLMIASRQQTLTVVRYLGEMWQGGAKVRDNNEETTLHFACRGQKVNVVEYLAKLNPDALVVRSKSDQNPIELALEYRNKKTAEMLGNLEKELNEVQDEPEDKASEQEEEKEEEEEGEEEQEEEGEENEDEDGEEGDEEGEDDD